jgi:pimeloyl-ACP methyl ester carboxylesterase
MGRIVVDYEELHRLSRVWDAAARRLARQALSVAALAADPAIALEAAFDPLGAARSERAILSASAVPHGLAALSVRLAADAVALDAVVVKEQVVDDFPARELAAFGRSLATAWIALPLDPAAALRRGRKAINDLGNALLGYLSPAAEPLLAIAAPSVGFRVDVALRRPLALDPVFGVPLALVSDVAPEGVGQVFVSSYRPSWSGTPAGSLGSVLRRVADLERAPAASLAIERVLGHDGVARYLVELPGMRHPGASPDPQDLSGAVSAMVLPVTGYTRCVTRALDAVGAPRGAEVMLVGHSQGGIVAMDLAGDPAFNGGRVRVTHVVTAGSPISSKRVAAGSGTKVLSVENVNDIVTHLDGVDSAASPQTADRLTYQYSADRHDIVGTHDPQDYARHLDELADSPNPLLRRFDAGTAQYLRGTTTTSIFTLVDGRENEPGERG